MKYIVFPILLFLFVPITLFFSFYALGTVTLENEVHAQEVPPVQIFTALPDTYPSLSVVPDSADARTLIIQNYLKERHSPLAPYASKIVSEADKDGIDFRLLTAIGQQESNLCRYAPDNTYNCWGWGINKAGTLGFTSFDEAIEVVSLGLKQEYVDKGLTTPDQIMSKYTPTSNGSWANGVQTFLDNLE